MRRAKLLDGTNWRGKPFSRRREKGWVGAGRRRVVRYTAVLPDPACVAGLRDTVGLPPCVESRCITKPCRSAIPAPAPGATWCWIRHPAPSSEEHTSDLQSLMRNSYAVFCLIKKIN